MIKCKFLEQYRIPTVALIGEEYIESERCRLGNEIPLGGCLDNCPDFESPPYEKPQQKQSDQ